MSVPTADRLGRGVVTVVPVTSSVQRVTGMLGRRAGEILATAFAQPGHDLSTRT